MNDTKGQTEGQENKDEPHRKDSFKGICPFCLSDLDVYLDIKQRPYWRCWRCEVRSFGTKTAMKTLTAYGWIWEEERPLKELRAWLKRAAIAMGLRQKGKR